jgi:SRSO17 transposase
VVDVQGLLRLDVELKAYVEDVFSSWRRKGWQERSHCYLTGLMLDGRRKSVEPMAARLGEANDQSLQHFLANTPWDPVPVRARLARKMHKAINPTAWVADDTGFTKDGRLSPCVARQYTGTAGKITNCQVATTLHLASDEASCPIDWRLFMPESWDPDSDKASPDVDERRAAAGIPPEEHHRPKWQLALECVDEALSWGVPAPPVLAADAGYGDAAGFRHGLTERGIPYAVQISHTLSVLPETATRTTPPYRGRGPRPKPRYEQDPMPVKDHIIAAGRRRTRAITWRTDDEGVAELYFGYNDDEHASIKPCPSNLTRAAVRPAHQHRRTSSGPAARAAAGPTDPAGPVRRGGRDIGRISCPTTAAPDAAVPGRTRWSAHLP